MSSTDTVETEPGSPGPAANAALPLGPFLFTAERLRDMEKQRSAALSAGVNEVSSAPSGSHRRQPQKKQGTSKYRGVNLHRRSCRWDAHAWHERQVHLGCFDYEVQAAVAYDIAALKLKGSRAKLNFSLSNYTQELQYLEGLTFAEVVAALRSSRRQLLTLSRLKTSSSVPTGGPSGPPAAGHASPHRMRPHDMPAAARIPARTPSPTEDEPQPKHRCLHAGSKPSSPSTSYTSHQSPHHLRPSDAQNPSSPTSPRSSRAVPYPARPAPTHPHPAAVPLSYLPLSYAHMLPHHHPASHATYFATTAASHSMAQPTVIFCPAPTPSQAPHQPFFIRYQAPHHYPAATSPPHYNPHAPTFVIGAPPAATVTDKLLAVDAHSASASAYLASDSLLLQASRARSKRLRECYPDPDHPSSAPFPASHDHPPGHPAAGPADPHRPDAHPDSPHLPPPPRTGHAHHPAAAAIASTRVPCYVVYDPQAGPLPLEGQPDHHAAAAADAKPTAATYIPVQRLQLPPGLRVL